jgi:hypothetical protein
MHGQVFLVGQLLHGAFEDHADQAHDVVPFLVTVGAAVDVEASNVHAPDGEGFPGGGPAANFPFQRHPAGQARQGVGGQVLPAALERALHPGQQFQGVVGFGDVFVGAQFETGDFVAGVPQAGEQNDRDEASGRVLAQALTHFETVHPRQQHVQENQIRELPPGRFEGLFSVDGGEDLVGVLPQQGAQHIDLPGVVFGDENARRGIDHSSPSR